MTENNKGVSFSWFPNEYGPHGGKPRTSYTWKPFNGPGTFWRRGFLTKIRSHGWAINIYQPGDSSRDLSIHKIRRAGGGELCPGHFSWICECLVFGIQSKEIPHMVLKIGDESHGRILKKPPAKQRSNFFDPIFFPVFRCDVSKRPKKRSKSSMHFTFLGVWRKQGKLI